MDTQTDTTPLLQSALAGDDAAWEALVRLWLPRVQAWCRRLGGPRVQPDDAAHDVFLVVFDRLGSLRQPEHFPAWLFGITRKVLASHRRRAWWRRHVASWTIEMRDPRPDPLRMQELSELTQQVFELLEQLPARQREVLVLHEVEGLTAPQLAELLTIPEGTVRSRLRAGRQHFQKLARCRGLVPEPQNPGGAHE